MWTVRLKLLLHAASILIVTSVVADDACSKNVCTSPELLTNTMIKPIHYNLKFITKPPYKFIEGETDIIIHIQEITATILLHASNLLIKDSTIMLSKADWKDMSNAKSSETYKIRNHSYCARKQILVLCFYHNIKPGLYNLTMKYAATLNDEVSLLPNPLKNNDIERWLLVRLSKPKLARTLFPCWDDLAFKTTFNISVLHPKEYTILSNMPKWREEHEADRLKWTHFHKSHSLSTSEVIFLMVEAINMDCSIRGYKNIVTVQRKQLTKQMQFALHIIERAVIFMNSYTEVKQKIPKTKHVALSNNPEQVVRSTGLAVYRKEDMTYDEEMDFPGRKHDIALLISQEIAREWFRDIISLSSWSELWFSESLALFFRHFITNEILWNSMDVMNLYVVQHLQQLLRDDIMFSTGSITDSHNEDDINAKFITPPEYSKGCALIHMMQHFYTQYDFQLNIFRQFFAHSISAANFWQVAETVLTDCKGEIELGYNLTNVMNTWLWNKYFPTVKVMNYNTGEITIEQYTVERKTTEQRDDNVEIIWEIPITITTQSNPIFSNTMPQFWLTSKKLSFNMHRGNDWVIVNLQQAAPYRVNYDTRNWKRIARDLSYEDHSKIHVVNRAQLIDDSYYFMMKNQLDSSVFLNIIRYLKRETNYIPWYPMMNIFSYISDFFDYPEGINIKAFMLEILGSLLAKIGYEEPRDEYDLIRTLRILAITWACKLGHAECKQKATDALVAHLRESQTSVIKPWLQDWIYCMGLIDANMTTWQLMMDKYKTTRNTKILKYLSCSENDWIIRHYYQWLELKTVMMKKTMQYKWYTIVYRTFLRRHANKDVILKEILQNLESNEHRNTTTIWSLYDVILNVNTERQLNTIRNAIEELITDEDILNTVEYLITLRSNQINKTRVMFDRF